jgi:hypothetical protein
MTFRVRRLVSFVAATFLLTPVAHAQTPAPAADAVKVTIYGTIVATGSVADHQFNIPDIPVWAVQDTARLTPPSIGSQQPAGFDANSVTVFEMSARQTRAGIKVEVPKGNSKWTPSGQIEIDFFGERPATGQGTVFNHPRIRLALVSLKNASGWNFVAGQDWMIFAPLNPTSFAHFAVPEAAFSGNPWMRLPQFRVDKTTKLGSGSKALLFQAGILRPTGGGDSPVAGTLSDGVSLSAERSGQPFYQGRLAVTGTRSGRAQAVGVSGHYGKEKAEPQTMDTWGVALDGNVSLGSKFGVSGELWKGANLDTFQAGIGQGLTQTNTIFREVDAQGGWIQGSIFATPSLSINSGFGQDDPDDAALTALVTRSMNQVFWTNVMVKPHPNVTIAFEYNWINTTFRAGPTAPERPGQGNFGNVAVVLAF